MVEILKNQLEWGYILYSEITKQLGHRVEIHSEVGKGTIVQITFFNV